MAEKKETNENVFDTDKPVAKKKPGGKSASIEINNTAKKQEISQIIKNGLKWVKRDIVKSDEECAERLDEFFAECARTGEIPTVEKMALALGTVREVVWKWGNGVGCSSERSLMIKKAKQILANIDAELVLGRKIPETTYIFRSKNYYGMRDNVELTVAPQNPLGDTLDQKELEAKIADIVIDED